MKTSRRTIGAGEIGDCWNDCAGASMLDNCMAGAKGPVKHSTSRMLLQSPWHRVRCEQLRRPALWLLTRLRRVDKMKLWSMLEAYWHCAIYREDWMIRISRTSGTYDNCTDAMRVGQDCQSARRIPGVISAGTGTACLEFLPPMTMTL